jgi:hypothetical protein
MEERVMPQQSTGRRRFALSILLTAVLVAIANSASAAAVPKPSADPFYKPTPGYAAKKPGKILRTRRLPLTPGTGVAGRGASAVYQVLYRTTDEHGRPSATVATIFLPSHRASGPRRLVSYQLAEDSLTTACAPSYTLRLAQPPGSQGTTINWNGSHATIADPIVAALGQGWVVVTSDYEGPGSQLLVPNLEGRMTLDGIRAAEQLRAAGLPGKATKVGLLGYSGGSVPSVSAGRLAPAYAPDVRLAGVTAGGVDADPLYVLAHIDGSIAFGGVTLGLIGFDRAYPQLDAFSLFNPAGLAIAKTDAVDGYGCAGGVIKQPMGTAAQYTNYPTSQALAAVPRVKRILAKLSLAKGAVPTAPSLIYNTVHDEIMRIPQVDALVHHWCAAGFKVYYDRSSVGEHISGINVYNALALRYLQSRFAGHPAPSTCASGPHDPKQ